MSASPVSNPPLETPPAPVLPPVRAAAVGAPPAAPSAEGAAEQADDGAALGGPRSLLARLGDWTADGEISAWLSSAVLHAAFVLLLSLWVLSRPGLGPSLLLEGFVADDPLDEAELDFTNMSEGGLASSQPRADLPDLGALEAIDHTVAATTTTPLPLEPLAAVGEMAFDPFPAMATPMAMHGGGLEGRGLANRHGRALSGGGSNASEAAVEEGLRWLAEHQWPDGGWRFDLEQCPNCAGYCRNSGVRDSSTAATGLALLGFLGAGYTHQQGQYAEVVKRGVYFLHEQMTISTFGGDLRDMRVNTARAENTPAGMIAAMNQLARKKSDDMYSHGIATLALTEAYAMTEDPNLREPAELAVQFIINGQNKDGGWRYEPAFEKPTWGDTTVSGWQVMALKSAVLGGIPVPYEVWSKISQFLDSNALNDGAEYAYVRGEKPTGCTTAIGLLCRELEGWPLSHRPLQRGLSRLGAERPQDNHIYYNYYATLTLHHAGGPEWRKWNPRMRDYLIETQNREGHERGSWYFKEPFSSDGGRLYTTALSVLTLEVYYRYLPLYQSGRGGE